MAFSSRYMLIYVNVPIQGLRAPLFPYKGTILVWETCCCYTFSGTCTSDILAPLAPISITLFFATSGDKGGSLLLPFSFLKASKAVNKREAKSDSH